MMPLTATQVMELRKLIQNHWTAFMVQNFGADAIGLGSEAVASLVQAGILEPTAAAMIDPFADAYMLGFLRDRMATAGINPDTVSLVDLKTLIQTNPIPMQPVETAAMLIARQEAGMFASALGNRMENDLLMAAGLENSDARLQLSQIQDETEYAVVNRSTANQLASRLAEVTGDYERDWHRLAVTELQNAQEKGYARVVESETGKQSLVAKLVNADACHSCVDAYCESDRVTPKIFTLEELQANGTNVGRKTSEYLPTVGPIHPHCDCKLIRVPKGFGFNEINQLVPVSMLKEKHSQDLTNIIDNADDLSVT
jgi:hypothetical protein